MASAKQLAAFEKLQEFFRSKVQAEVRSDFARISPLPESRVVNKLRYYGLLSESDKLAFLDCCAYWASAYYSFVIKLPRISLTNHPFFSKWSQGPSWNWDFDNHALRPFGHYETDVLGNYCCKR